MIQDPDTYRQLARQRERELIDAADRDRLAKAASKKSRGRSPDSRHR